MFSYTAKTLMENIGKSNNNFQDFLKNPNEYSFFINESIPEEIMHLAAERIINHLYIIDI